MAAHNVVRHAPLTVCVRSESATVLLDKVMAATRKPSGVLREGRKEESISRIPSPSLSRSLSSSWAPALSRWFTLYPQQLFDFKSCRPTSVSFHIQTVRSCSKIAVLKLLVHIRTNCAILYCHFFITEDFVQFCQKCRCL